MALAITRLPTPSDIPALAASFRRALRARNRSQKTIKTYLDAVDHLAAFLDREGYPLLAADISRAHVRDFVADQVERHRPNTAATRYRALQQFFRWLVEEGEIAQSPMSGMRAPLVPEEPPPVPTDEEIRAILRTCDGNDLFARRDAAIIRMFADTGMRAAELAGLRVEDIDMERQQAFVRNAKMRRPRLAPFGAKTASALDRYLRARTTRKTAANAPRADRPMLLLRSGVWPHGNARRGIWSR